MAQLLLIFFLISGESFGQSLGDYVEKAVENSHIKQTHKLGTEELKHKKEVVGLWQNPSVSLEYGRVKNTGITGSQVAASIEQQLPINGSLGLNKKEVELEIKQYEILSQWKVNEFKALVINKFLELWLEREKITHANHRKKNLDLLKKYLRTQKFSSPQQKADAYLIKKKIDQINYELRENSFKEKELVRVLEQLTGEEIKDFDLKLRTKVSLEKAFDELIKTNPSLNKLRTFQRKRGQIAVTKAARRWVPDVNLGYSYQKENVPGGNLGHAVGLSFSIPLNDTGSSQTKQYRAAMRLNEGQWRLKDLQRESQIKALKEKFHFYTDLVEGSLQKEEKDHENDLKRTKGYFLKGLINAQTYLDTEELGHELHYREVNAIKKIVEVFVLASIKTGKEIDLTEVLL